ncbi:3-phosphoshikimate 1-carboxyvinyltransferase [Galbitalea sp. SE-J8]|uniref:3-phosphoshikimate 1-carboxyvinyltransferase n=1 Tax=Galbitalea sp. SE-J8 TaxID=3054952 RepID=UPI00259CE76F|nr:3-phosphoshikimate 1-carboxyvinyltransferase [Galbitalea sp. SE-J8]MDM4764137.1 3-phosphoshikimate 1-carboxyvinyltransferase [Galbitalea sp. SE-J8]
MQEFRYSGRDFSPYDDEVVDPDETGWVAPRALGPLGARMRLPGSKSITNRELVLSALADAPSLLRAPLLSRDTLLMIEGLRSLGVVIEEVDGDGGFGPDLRITPPAILEGSTSIDCGLAGTVMRFLPPVAALALGPVAFDGDEHARRRPMRTTVDALRALGVDVSDDGRGALPFSLWGRGAVAGGELAIDASSSSQFVSGLLLAAPRFENGLTLRHTGETLPSPAHIRMTIDALSARGVEVGTPEDGVWVVPPHPIAGREADVEPDLSNAGPFLAAAAIAGGDVTIVGWPTGTTQVGERMPDILAEMGAVVSRVGDELTVSGSGELHGLHLDEASELAPTVAAVAALADSETRLTGIAHLRGHETDRLAALATEITGLGGDVTETDDGLVIRPAALHGGDWHSYADHRMATAGALIGLAVDGVVVDDVETTAKTLPQFVGLWTAMLATASVAPDPTGGAPTGIALPSGGDSPTGTASPTDTGA